MPRDSSQPATNAFVARDGACDRQLRDHRRPRPARHGAGRAARCRLGDSKRPKSSISRLRCMKLPWRDLLGRMRDARARAAGFRTPARRRPNHKLIQPYAASISPPSRGLPLPPPSVALVDFASVCTSAKVDSVVRDSLDLLGVLIREVVKSRLSAGTTHEVDVRLYGGWRDISGQPTEQRVWITRHLNRLRSIQDRVRLVPTVVDSILSAPRFELHGTYKNRGQKMVDVMIVEDAHSVAQMPGTILMLVSDDDDFVPAMLALTMTTPLVVLWLRQRVAAENDKYFRQGSIEMLVSPSWR